MPAHDWTRVDAGVFHSFHTAWISELTKVLNNGLLPPDYYALGEQVAGFGNPDVLTLQTPAGPTGNGHGRELTGSLATATAPPQVLLTSHLEQRLYVRKQKRVVVRHISNHRVIAMIELVSSGNKDGQHAINTFINKVLSALEDGIHQLIIDLFPPGPRDPQGIHGMIWGELGGWRQAYEQPAGKPLTLVSYAAGLGDDAYIQPLAVADPLPEMPLFLTAENYVNVPLEATYEAAYQSVPRFYRTASKPDQDQSSLVRHSLDGGSRRARLRRSRRRPVGGA